MTGRKRKGLDTHDSGSTSSTKKMKQQSLGGAFENSNRVTQSTVDTAVMNLVVGALLPLRIVDVPEYVELIQTLQPNSHVLCRKTLRARIDEAANESKRKLMAVLKSVQWVATTTDCWSTYGKAFIGVTVHWIASGTLERRSACLALRRIMGRHTYDLIASTLENIHSEFGIRKKVSRTTTDNGANFVKAFSVFGEQAAEINAATADPDEDDDEPDERGREIVDVYSTLSENDSDTDFSLPKHQRCACHTLNLISTGDADMAERDPQYKKVSRAAFAKCQALWNKYGRSVQAVEVVTQAFGIGLKRPNATRWNSVFMATERLVRLMTDHEVEFSDTCSKLDVPRFSDAEVAFLNEYVSVMKPVAQALNILQSDSKMYMGYLLPTLSALKDKLTGRQPSATVCKPLLTALLNGINRRFADSFADPELVAAAILHPKFRQSWTTDQSLLDNGLQHIRNLLPSVSTSSSENASTTSASADTSDVTTDTGTDDDDFFIRRPPPTTSGDVLSQYLSSVSDETASIAAWPALKSLFIRFNTPLPASAACERLFSYAGLTMNSHRTRMSDNLFEQLVLLKVNKSLPSHQ